MSENNPEDKVYRVVLDELPEYNDKDLDYLVIPERYHYEKDLIYGGDLIEYASLHYEDFIFYDGLLDALASYFIESMGDNYIRKNISWMTFQTRIKVKRGHITRLFIRILYTFSGRPTYIIPEGFQFPQDLLVFHLPENIENMSKLEELCIEDLHLSFPPQIGKLEALKFLYCFNSIITPIPEEIGCLSNLEELVIKDCQISELPATLGNLQNLRFLDIRNCGLYTLPESLGNLNKLERFYFSGNNFESFPISMVDLPIYPDIITLDILKREVITKATRYNEVTIKEKFEEVIKQKTSLGDRTGKDFECLYQKCLDSLDKLFKSIREHIDYIYRWFTEQSTIPWSSSEEDRDAVRSYQGNIKKNAPKEYPDFFLDFDFNPFQDFYGEDRSDELILLHPRVKHENYALNRTVVLFRLENKFDANKYVSINLEGTDLWIYYLLVGIEYTKDMFYQRWRMGESADLILLLVSLRTVFSQNLSFTFKWFRRQTSQQKETTLRDLFQLIRMGVICFSEGFSQLSHQESIINSANFDLLNGIIFSLIIPYDELVHRTWEERWI